MDLPVGLRMAADRGCDHAEYQCLSSALAVVPAAMPTPGYSINGLRPEAAAASAPKWLIKPNLKHETTGTSVKQWLSGIGNRAQHFRGNDNFVAKVFFFLLLCSANDIVFVKRIQENT